MQHSTHSPGGEINGPRMPSLDTLTDSFMIPGSEDEKTYDMKLPSQETAAHTCRTDSGYLCPTPNELSPPAILHESTVSHPSAELSVVTLNSGHTGSSRNTKHQTNAPLAQE